jgi:hypothetical protein
MIEPPWRPRASCAEDGIAMVQPGNRIEASVSHLASLWRRFHNGMDYSIGDAMRRINELEQLASTLRHGVNGALTPALMMADRLRTNTDPRIQRAGETIANSITRAVELLKSSRATVASKRD